MLLVSKQKIYVSLSGDIKVVLVAALVAAGGEQQELPANGTLQNGGHMLFLYQS
jgi:hypothetical protein